MSDPQRDNLVDTGRRSTERSRDAASRLVGVAWQFGRTRAEAAQEYMRDRLRAELDALGVASRSDLARATEEARRAAAEAAEAVRRQAALTQAARDDAARAMEAATSQAVAVPSSSANEELLFALRDTMQRGFELLAARIDAVASDTKADIDALRRDLVAQGVEQRAGFDLLTEEITGVGRATRRDLERVRNEMTQLEAAIREGTDRMVEALASPRPLLSAVQDAVPVPIEIRPETPVEAVVVEVADVPRRNAHPEHPAGQSGRSTGPGARPTSPVEPAEIRPLTDNGARSGRIESPRWSAEPRPSGPIVDLSKPDPDEPPLSVTDLRTARVQPPV